MCIRDSGDPSTSIADQVYLFLQKPLADLLAERGGRMIFTGLHEGFFTQIKVAFFTSISISSYNSYSGMEICCSWTIQK